MTTTIPPWCPWCFDTAHELDSDYECRVEPIQNNGRVDWWRCRECQVQLPREEWARAMVWAAERHNYDESEYGPDVERARTR